MDKPMTHPNAEPLTEAEHMTHPNAEPLTEAEHEMLDQLINDAYLKPMFRLRWQVKNNKEWHHGQPVIEDEATAKAWVDKLDKEHPELTHTYEWVLDPTHAAG